ncbi:hypothetical protein [Acrocarpospora sp. B8E8]|uniref:hypothetical protein n=1 Tax=Acrocarpospora sp. B8E8 TaxID=3153572 RepID=UPI00325DB6E2
MIVRGLALAACLAVLLAVVAAPAGDLGAALYEFAYAVRTLVGMAALLLAVLYGDRLMGRAWRRVTRRGTTA